MLLERAAHNYAADVTDVGFSVGSVAEVVVRRYASKASVPMAADKNLFLDHITRTCTVCTVYACSMYTCVCTCFVVVAELHGLCS